MTAQVLAPGEKDIFKIVAAINQLVQGRSNAVGTVTLVHDGATTTTAVSAPNCAAGSKIFLAPQTAHAATAWATTYVLTSNVTKGQFVVSHAATAQADQTFAWVALG